MNWLIKKTDKRAITPVKGSPHAAGFDLFAIEDVKLTPGVPKKVRTGISCSWDDPSVYLQIKERSGLALKGLRVGGGVIDFDYRGEIMVILINTNKEDYQITAGDKVAQIVPLKIAMDITTTLVDSLDETIRGDGGFGSTGK